MKLRPLGSSPENIIVSALKASLSEDPQRMPPGAKATPLSPQCRDVLEARLAYWIPKHELVLSNWKGYKKGGVA